MTISFGTLQRGLQAEFHMADAAADYPADTCAKQLWKWLTSWIKRDDFKKVMPVLLARLDRARKNNPDNDLRTDLYVYCYFSRDQYLRLDQYRELGGQMKLSLTLYDEASGAIIAEETINTSSGQGCPPLEHLYNKLCVEYQETRSCLCPAECYMDYEKLEEPRRITRNSLQQIVSANLLKSATQ